MPSATVHNTCVLELAALVNIFFEVRGKVHIPELGAGEVTLRTLARTVREVWIN